LGTTPPGQNFIYLHLNRVTTTDDLDMIYVAGPGHGGAAVVANTYPGLQKLFLQFSFPGGMASHSSPECPGSIHEGGLSRRGRCRWRR